ncbi:MAG: class I SAM-dependent methyltransferase [Ginsengibacter sp.]
MNEVLKEIIASQKVRDKENQSYNLHSHTGELQGRFLQEILKNIKPKATLEIGLAYGISSLFILEILKDLENENGSHIIFDPFPDVYWNNIGLLNIRKAGYENLVDFRKLFSDEGLIELINEKKKIQFAYIDSTKVFDILLVDFYLINKIMDIGGVIIFDDCGFPGIKKLVKLISKMPFYKIYGTHYKEQETLKKNLIKRSASFVLRHAPFRNKIFPGIDFKTDQQNGIDYHCIAFEKTSDDKRSWDWYVDF